MSRSMFRKALWAACFTPPLAMSIAIAHADENNEKAKTELVKKATETAVAAVTSTSKEEFKKDFVGKLREYAREKVTQKTIDEIFDNETVNDIVDLVFDCKIPLSPGCIYTALFKSKVAGDPNESERIEIDRNRLKASEELLNQIFPVWKEKKAASKKEGKSLIALGEMLERKQSALGTRREKLNAEILDFRSFAIVEQAAISSDREKLIKAEEALRNSLENEQASIKRDIDAFANSEVVKQYSENQAHWPKYFEQQLKHLNQKEANFAPKIWADHFRKTGDLLPDMHIPFSGRQAIPEDVALWKKLVDDNNRWNREFKESTKRFSDRTTNLEKRAKTESDKLLSQSRAWELRLKQFEEKSKSMEEKIRSFEVSGDSLQAEYSNLEKKARDYQNTQDNARSLERLVRQCISELGRINSPSAANWRTNFENVIQMYSNEED